MDEIININTVVKDKTFNEFINSIICPICQNIMINPVLCFKCQASFCQKCIDDWCKINNENCPNRCNKPNYQRSFDKEKLLSKFKFKCKKCERAYYYDEIRMHYNKCDSSTNMNNFTSNIKAEKKLLHLSEKEIDKIKKNGEDITYIKSKIYIFYF